MVFPERIDDGTQVTVAVFRNVTSPDINDFIHNIRQGNMRDAYAVFLRMKVCSS